MTKPPALPLLLCTFPVVLILAAGAAHATDRDGTAATAAPAIEEIVVTASKREELLSAVGSSVTAIGGEAMQARALRTTEDIALYVPNMTYGENLGSSYITIRGIGLNVNTSVAEQGVATHIDGVYVAPAVSGNLVQFDVDRVEVLRGPQGTLYGRNATGGTVNYIGRRPTEQPESGFRFGIGRYDQFHGDVFVSGPIANNVLGRIAVRKERADGHGRYLLTGDDYGGADRVTAKGQLSLLPADSVRIDLAGYFTDESVDGPVPENITPFAAGSPLGGMEASFTLKPHQSWNDVQARQRNRMALYSGTVRWDMTHATLTAITGHVDSERRQRNDIDSSNLPFLNNRFPVESKSYSQEINASGNTDRLKWIVGVYAFAEDLEASNRIFTGAGDEFTFIRRRIDTVSYSAFTDLTWSLTGRLRAVAGARFNYDRKEGDCFRRAGGNTITGDVEDSWTEFLPKGGLEFDLGEQTMVYAQYQEGFKSGGLNESPASCEMFEPESIKATEIGVKTALLNRRLQLSAAAFHYDYQDLQQTILDAQTLTTDIRNAAEVRVLGVELEGTAHLGARVRSDFAFGYLDAEYRRFDLLDQLDVAAGEQDLSGRQVVLSPRHTATLGLEFDLPGQRYPAVLRVEGFHSAGYPLRAFNHRDERQGSYEIANAYLTLDLGERYRLRGFGKNLTDSTRVLSVYETALSGSLNGFYNRPRTWGVELSAAF